MFSLLFLFPIHFLAPVLGSIYRERIEHTGPAPAGVPS